MYRTGARGHHHRLARQRAVCAQRGAHLGYQRVYLRQPPLRHQSRRQPAGQRLHHAHAPFPQRGDVGLRGGMGVHAAVHGRRRQRRRPRAQVDAGQEIVRQPVRHARQRVSGGGNDRQQVGLFRQVNVQDAPGRRRKEFAVGGSLRHAGERERRDEPLGVLREDRSNLRLRLRELARQRHRLESGYAAANAQQNALSLEHAHAPTPPCRRRAHLSSYTSLRVAGRRADTIRRRRYRQ